MATITGGATEFGTAAANGTIQALGHHPGRTDGMLATRSALHRRNYALQGGENRSVADTYTFFAATTGPGASGSTITGTAYEFIGNTGLQWFEKIHIFPGGSLLNPSYDQNYKLDFGNILTDTDRRYEIFNASRRSTQTLSAIDLSAVSPGIETPNVTALDTVGPQQSILDPTSTFNTDGVTGLGTLVIPTVRALQDGIPNFDNNAVFSFGLNNVLLPMRGSRIALALADYELPLVETMSFATDILRSTSGKEQRHSLRKEPREGMRVTYRLDGIDRQRFQAVLMDWQENPFGVPLWHEQVALSAESAAASTQWQVTGASVADFRVGGLAILHTDDFTFDVATIVSVTDTLITVDSQNSNTYPAGTRCAPVRVARIVKVPQGARYHLTLEDFRVTYEWMDSTGAPAASSTAWNSNTYDGRILLDDCNIMRNRISEVYDRDISVIDGVTGLVTQLSGWDKNQHVWAKGFYAKTRAEIQNLKALLRYLRGRQKSFWVPTKIEDLTPSAALISGSQILDITHIDYLRYVRQRSPKNVIRVTYNNGNPAEIKEITSSAAHPSDSQQERLTVDTGWANNQALDTIERVEFLELCRLDADNFTLTMADVGSAKMTAPIRTVFDDD